MESRPYVTDNQHIIPTLMAESATTKRENARRTGILPVDFWAFTGMRFQRNNIEGLVHRGSGKSPPLGTAELTLLRKPAKAGLTVTSLTAHWNYWVSLK
jgi:hypothetical protein